MPKISVTEQLANTLKLIRQENRVAAKELATHISKSQSYISKLENGIIKFITREELDRIISFITSDREDFSDKINELLSSAVYRYTKTELEEQVWFANYSMVFCKIPIPEELIEDIRIKMAENNISTEYLCERINANEFIPESEKSSKVHPQNEWFARNDNQRLAILMDLSIEKVDSILSYKEKSTRYIYLQAIATYILKIINFGTQVQLSDECNEKLTQQSKEYLSSYNFYSLSERNKRIINALQDNEKSMLLCKQDQTNLSLVGQIYSIIQRISEVDVQKANQLLSSFLANLEWDEGFILHLASLDFNKLGKVTFAFKQELLNNIKLLLEDAFINPNSKNKIERYS